MQLYTSIVYKGTLKNNVLLFLSSQPLWYCCHTFTCVIKHILHFYYFLNDQLSFKDNKKCIYWLKPFAFLALFIPLCKIIFLQESWRSPSLCPCCTLHPPLLCHLLHTLHTCLYIYPPTIPWDQYPTQHLATASLRCWDEISYNTLHD